MDTYPLCICYVSISDTGSDTYLEYRGTIEPTKITQPNNDLEPRIMKYQHAFRIMNENPFG